MKFACESCRAQYMISDEKVGPRGVKVRCKKCSHVNVVRRPAPATDPDLVAAPPAPERPSGNLDDEIGAAFDNVVDGTPGPAGAPAPARLPAAPPVDLAKPPPNEFDLSDEGPEVERTRLVAMPEMQRAFEQQERAPEPAPAPVAAAAADWYVAIDDQQVGPLALDEVRRRWDAGEIGPDTLCWRTGMADWTALTQIPALAETLAPRASAAPAEAGWIAAAMAPQEAPAPSWKPSAASALAALVEAESEAARQSAPAAEATLERDLAPAAESTGIRSLIRDLPTASVPAPEQSRLLPLTSAPAPAPVAVPAPEVAPQHRAPAAPAAKAPAAAPAPAAAGKGGAGRWVAAAAVLVVVAAAAFFARGLVGGSAEQPAAPVAAAPAPAPVAPPAPVTPPPAPPAEAVPAAAPSEEEATAALADAANPAPAEPAAGEAVAAAPEKAEEVEEAEKAPDQVEPAVAAAPAAAVPARTAPTRRATQQKRQALAATAPRRQEPTPAPAPGGGGSLLDAAGSTSAIDDLFEREFTPSKKAAPKGGGGTYIPPAPGTGGKPAQLSQGDIAGVVVGHKGALKTCVTDYKGANPGSSGTVVMRWSIKPDGRTTGVKPVKGAEHKELASCIGGLVRGWKFPAYSGPQMAPIDFPFQF